MWVKRYFPPERQLEFGGKTLAEWIEIERELDELKKFINDRLDEVLKGMKEET